MQGNDKIARARTERLLVEEIADDLVVYDLDNDHAHALNRTVALVWRKCDGERTVGAAATELSEDLGMVVTPLIVQDAIEQLAAANLLETEVTERHGMSRRQLLIKAGLTAAALPVLTSILAPTAAAAVSANTPNGQPCPNTAAPTTGSSTTYVTDAGCASRCCRRSRSGGVGSATCVACNTVDVPNGGGCTAAIVGANCTTPCATPGQSNCCNGAVSGHCN